MSDNAESAYFIIDISPELRARRLTTLPGATTTSLPGPARTRQRWGVCGGRVPSKKFRAALDVSYSRYGAPDEFNRAAAAERVIMNEEGQHGGPHVPWDDGRRVRLNPSHVVRAALVLDDGLPKARRTLSGRGLRRHRATNFLEGG